MLIRVFICTFILILIDSSNGLLHNYQEKEIGKMTVVSPPSSRTRYKMAGVTTQYSSRERIKMAAMSPPASADRVKMAVVTTPSSRARITKRYAVMSAQNSEKTASVRGRPSRRHETLRTSASGAGLRRRYDIITTPPTTLLNTSSNSTPIESEVKSRLPNSMPETLDNYFRPIDEDVPTDHRVPFQEFGMKLAPTATRHRSDKLEEDETGGEEMDVRFNKAYVEANKAPQHIMHISRSSGHDYNHTATWRRQQMGRQKSVDGAREKPGQVAAVERNDSSLNDSKESYKQSTPVSVQEKSQSDAAQKHIQATPVSVQEKSKSDNEEKSIQAATMSINNKVHGDPLLTQETRKIDKIDTEKKSNQVVTIPRKINSEIKEGDKPTTASPALILKKSEIDAEEKTKQDVPVSKQKVQSSADDSPALKLEVLPTTKVNRTSTGFTLLQRTRNQIMGAKKNFTLANRRTEKENTLDRNNNLENTIANSSLHGTNNKITLPGDQLLDNSIAKTNRGNVTRKSAAYEIRTSKARFHNPDVEVFSKDEQNRLKVLEKMKEIRMSTTQRSTTSISEFQKPTSKILSTAVVTSISVLDEEWTPMIAIRDVVTASPKYRYAVAYPHATSTHTSVEANTQENITFKYIDTNRQEGSTPKYRHTMRQEGSIPKYTDKDKQESSTPKHKYTHRQFNSTPKYGDTNTETNSMPSFVNMSTLANRHKIINVVSNSTPKYTIVNNVDRRRKTKETVEMTISKHVPLPPTPEVERKIINSTEITSTTALKTDYEVDVVTNVNYVTNSVASLERDDDVSVRNTSRSARQEDVEPRRLNAPLEPHMVNEQLGDIIANNTPTLPVVTETHFQETRVNNSTSSRPTPPPEDTTVGVTEGTPLLTGVSTNTPVFVEVTTTQEEIVINSTQQPEVSEANLEIQTVNANVTQEPLRIITNVQPVESVSEEKMGRYPEESEANTQQPPVETYPNTERPLEESNTNASLHHETDVIDERPSSTEIYLNPPLDEVELNLRDGITTRKSNHNLDSSYDPPVSTTSTDQVDKSAPGTTGNKTTSDAGKDEVEDDDVRRSSNPLEADGGMTNYVLGAFGLVPVVVGVLVAVRYCISRRNKIWESEKSPLTYVSTSEWEFPRSKLRLQTVLGQGNFGLVYKAEADDILGERATRLVAVKTIKDGATNQEKDDLTRELAILKKIGAHSNVVTLLGCCTEKEPYLLILEYVMYGKLLSFLRDNRTRRQYYNFSEETAELTAKDLTSFAYCIARGMEYLGSKGIIHRDLAARNILVDHNKICKVADFGMSRSISDPDQIYEQAPAKGVLPIRWMAPESLSYRVSTHKTDVWAFGILMWEIVTLGSTPYQSMSAREVIRQVREGYRLERPEHCRSELYRVATTCWSHDPTERPTFTAIKHELARLLEEGEPQNYVDLESYIESIANGRTHTTQVVNL